MKHLAYLTIALLLMSCTGETFIDVDPTEFNQIISARTDIKTPEELAKAYYEFPDEASTRSFVVSAVPGNNGILHITIIHDNLDDDSLRSRKVQMTATRSGGVWKVHSIKRNWRCWEGRGHRSWGTAPCS
ncbi:MAG: hypothetical protein JJ975_16915 [Bacteroidia bacterium]|nr:hypothetical protein [Bacteroidia bacterium]